MKSRKQKIYKKEKKRTKKKSKKSKKIKKRTKRKTINLKKAIKMLNDIYDEETK